MDCLTSQVFWLNGKIVQKCDHCRGTGKASKRINHLDTNCRASGECWQETDIDCDWCNGRGFFKIKLKGWPY